MNPQKFIEENAIGPFTYTEDGSDRTVLLTKQVVSCFTLAKLVEFSTLIEGTPRSWADESVDYLKEEAPRYKPVEERLAEQIDIIEDTLSPEVVRDLHRYYPDYPMPLAFSKFMENLVDAGMIKPRDIQGQQRVVAIPIARHLAEALIHSESEMITLFKKGIMRTDNNIFIVGQKEYRDVVVVDEIAYEPFDRIEEALAAPVAKVLYDDRTQTYTPSGFEKVRIVKEFDKHPGSAQYNSLLTAIFGSVERMRAVKCLADDPLLDPIPPGHGGIREFAVRFEYNSKISISLRDPQVLAGLVPAVFAVGQG